MRKKRFSLLHLAILVPVTAVLTAGILLGVLYALVGKEGLSLLEGLYLVNSRFVGEYDETQVVDSALSGMVDGLGDRWSYYLTQEEYEDQNQRRTNKYVGVGVTVDYGSEEGLRVVAVTADGPAEKAGIQAGELITAVDGFSLAGEARYEGAERIQGEEGTVVSLEIRSADGQTRTVELTRTSLDSDPVTAEMLEGNIGYVALANFYDNSAERLEEEVTRLQEEGAVALVFDMRNNGGGYLSELTDMLDFLLPEGPIFITRDRAGNEKVTESDEQCVDLPMAVLVNESTASAAELFACDLQEYGVATVVGTTTYGKGVMQTTYSLSDGGSLTLTTDYYNPSSGKNYNGVGVIPDIECPLTEQQQKDFVHFDPSHDPQLAAALEAVSDEKSS